MAVTIRIAEWPSGRAASRCRHQGRNANNDVSQREDLANFI